MYLGVDKAVQYAKIVVGVALKYREYCTFSVMFKLFSVVRFLQEGYDEEAEEGKKSIISLTLPLLKKDASDNEASQCNFIA